MLATVTDAHMPGDLVQSVGEVFWLSSFFCCLFVPGKEKVSAEGGGLVWVCNGFRLIVPLIACRRPYAYAPQ
ncbi:MAG TPA: hypothetical protein DEQ41_06310 [Shewanella sp.]|nr:hypothetical protein [Shewanella sp.]